MVDDDAVTYEDDDVEELVLDDVENVTLVELQVVVLDDVAGDDSSDSNSELSFSWTISFVDDVSKYSSLLVSSVISGFCSSDVSKYLSFLFVSTDAS